MVASARREPGTWHVALAWGHGLLLPALGRGAAGTLRLAVLGTRTLAPVPTGKSALMAGMLATLDCALYIFDTRRAGSGGQSSWSPREFASLIPALLGGRIPTVSSICLVWRRA